MAAQTRIQFRRGTALEWSGINPILYAGEMGYETDTKKIKVGDGTTFWNSLPYATVKPDDLNELVDDRINDLLTAGSNIQKTYNDVSNTLTLAVTGVSLTGHSHTSSDITNFNTSVSGLLPVKSIIAGSNISVTPTGDSGFVISANGGVDQNAVKDIIGSSVSGVSGVVVSYDNTSKLTTVGLSNPSITSSNISDFNSAVSGLINVKSLSQGTGIGITNNAGVHTISVTGIPSSLITDFSSSVGSVVSTEMVGGSGISFSYDSLTNDLTVSTTGVSYVGHSHVWSNITDASSKATLNELAYLSGVSPGSVSASRAVVVDSNKNLTGLGDVSTTGTLTVGGNLVVNGTTVTVNSTTVDIGDNIIRVNTSGLSTGGLEVVKPDSSTVSLLWNNVSGRWEFTGGNISTSNLFVGSLSGNASTVTNGVYTTDTGTVTSSMIADNTIVNGDISDSANIAITKLASSGLTLGSTTVSLGQTSTVLNGLSSISGTSLSSPTTLYNCIVDGGTP
jgi:hypothetical protein